MGKLCGAFVREIVSRHTGHDHVFQTEITGDTRDNIITGGAGKDELHGGAGKDQLFGGTGDDKLFGGAGIFGVEFFVTADEVIFSELSPRPHDTGMVTLISQELSEFALHVRAILGLPIPVIRQVGPSASCAVLIDADTTNLRWHNVADVLRAPDTALRLFGKPEVRGHRRMGVTLARGATIESARATARDMAAALVAGAEKL